MKPIILVIVLSACFCGMLLHNTNQQNEHIPAKKIQQKIEKTIKEKSAAGETDIDYLICNFSG